MKTKSICLALIGIVGLGTIGLMSRSKERDLIVHEWGTFTSLQGSDGVPLKWNPLESSRLPSFVYNWNHPGLERAPSGMLALGPKSALVTLQRMETPVVYFYSDKERTVDLSVGFPKGGITEWYPQAPEIGPSVVRPDPIISKLDSELQRCGLSSRFSLCSVFNKSVKDSMIHWSNLEILPAARHTQAAQFLQHDSAGSHYFAARETDSAYVESPSYSPTNTEPQCEKFLFYRGAGNFTTPLNVSMPSEDSVTLANTGKATLSHLFILGVKNHAGKFVFVDELKPGEEKGVLLNKGLDQPLAELENQIGDKLLKSLISEGLYPREATAMIKTWDNSWLEEQGVRVLYVLPRSWTDEILPMTINPEPKDLVRVMIGRAEIIGPQTEQTLSSDLTQALQGQDAAGQEVMETLKRLGRFAEPAFQQALNRAAINGESRDRLLGLLLAVRSRHRE